MEKNDVCLFPFTPPPPLPLSHLPLTRLFFLSTHVFVPLLEEEWRGICLVVERMKVFPGSTREMQTGLRWRGEGKKWGNGWVGEGRVLGCVDVCIVGFWLPPPSPIRTSLPPPSPTPSPSPSSSFTPNSYPSLAHSPSFGLHMCVT